MKKPLWLFLLIAGLLIVLSLGAQPQKFALAIVRSDGRLVPFAAYDGNNWTKAWPEADEMMEGTHTTQDTPSIWRSRGQRVPNVWRVWPTSGGRSFQARVKGVEVVEAHCQGQLALATDLPAMKEEHPLKFGVAVDSDVPISAIQAVRPSDLRWKAAESAVLAPFSKLEAAQAEAEHQQPLDERPAPTIQITGLYGEAQSPDSPLYFIAEKKYRTPRYPQDPQCTPLNVMTGWLVRRSDGILSVRSPKMFLTDCDGKEMRTALPLAAVHVSSRLFWILQEHGYEDETYLVAEIGPADVRYAINVNGGGC